MAVPTFSGSGSLPNIGVPYSEVGPTSVPDFSTLLNYLMQQGQQASQGVPKLSDIISQGMSSPLMQQILGPALQNLIPGEELARQNMSDMFTQAGMTGSGAQGVAGSRLEGALQQQRGGLISQVMSSILPTLVSGMNQQSANQFRFPELLAQALGISRPSTVTGSNQGMYGGGGGGQGGQGGQQPSMNQNPFFTPDPFAQAGGGGGGGQAGFNQGPQPGAPQGFQNPALTSFSYNTPGGGNGGAYGGGAWQPTTPIDWNAIAGLGGQQGSQFGIGGGGGNYYSDPYGVVGGNPYGTDYATNTGLGFGVNVNQPIPDLSQYNFGM